MPNPKSTQRTRKAKGHDSTLDTPSRKRGVKQSQRLSISSLPERVQLTRDRALHVLSAMRRDPKLSLSRAAKLQGIKGETVKKYFSSALKKTNGRMRVAKSDHFSAILYVPGATGNLVPIVTSSSKERKQVSQFLRDLNRHLRGDRNALVRWDGRTIAGVRLVTDSRILRAIEPALAGLSLYRAVNGAE